MDARGSVRSAAGAKFDFAQLEVFLELGPLLCGGFAVLRGWSGCAPRGEVGAVGLDQLGLEHGQVGVSGGEVMVAEDLGRDVHRESAGDGVGREHPAEVVRGVSQGLAGPVGYCGAQEGVVEQSVEDLRADDLPPPADLALEQMR